MDPIVKICGLSTEETLDAALEAGADMVGIVRFRPSPRHVGAAMARKLAARAKGRAERVLLTVDMPEDELDGTVEALRPDYIQFHGHETPEQVAAAAARTGCRTIKAVGIATGDDLITAEIYAAACDMLLLDARPPKDATRPGGHGRPFDWDLLAEFDAGLPYLLSGGLTPGNVGAALAKTNAAGVDASSGVETAPGRKDPDLIRAFVAAARAAALARHADTVAP